LSSKLAVIVHKAITLLLPNRTCCWTQRSTNL